MQRFLMQSIGQAKMFISQATWKKHLQKQIQEENMIRVLLTQLQEQQQLMVCTEEALFRMRIFLAKMEKNIKFQIGKMEITLFLQTEIH